MAKWRNKDKTNDKNEYLFLSIYKKMNERFKGQDMQSGAKGTQQQNLNFKENH